MRASATDRSAADLVVLADGAINIQGELNFDTVPGLMKQAEKLFAKTDKVQVDFNEVSNSNSAGLALMLEMMRYMASRNKTISFNNLPDQINVVARAYVIDNELEPYIKTQDS